MKTVDRYIELEAQIKELNAEKAKLKAKLLKSFEGRGVDFIAGSDDPSVGVLRVEAERTSLDTVAIKKELPELAARYSRTSTSVSLRVSDSINKRKAA